MHILVLGAAGMVGRKLTERLLRDGRLGERDISRMTLQDVVAPAKPDKTGFPVDTVTCDFAVPGLISAFIFCFTLCWNEFIYALTFLSSTQNKTVPVAIVNEFVDGDIYRWGSLMAGALAGSLPLVILYAFFVEHYVSAMTGAVKE